MYETRLGGAATVFNETGHLALNGTRVQAVGTSTADLSSVPPDSMLVWPLTVPRLAVVVPTACTCQTKQVKLSKPQTKFFLKLA